jgi:hypothetical protein
MTSEEAKNLIALLDRVEIKGHQERNVVNGLVQTLLNIANEESEQDVEVVE